MDPRATWYVAIEGKNEGPFTKDQIEQKIASDEINGDTFIYTAGMSDWEPLRQVGSPEHPRLVTTKVYRPPTTGSL